MLILGQEVQYPLKFWLHKINKRKTKKKIGWKEISQWTLFLPWVPPLGTPQKGLSEVGGGGWRTLGVKRWVSMLEDKQWVFCSAWCNQTPCSRSLVWPRTKLHSTLQFNAWMLCVPFMLAVFNLLRLKNSLLVLDNWWPCNLLWKSPKAANKESPVLWVRPTQIFHFEVFFLFYFVFEKIM